VPVAPGCSGTAVPSVGTAQGLPYRCRGTSRSVQCLQLHSRLLSVRRCHCNAGGSRRPAGAVRGVARRGSLVVICTAFVRPGWGRFAVRINTGVRRNAPRVARPASTPAAAAIVRKATAGAGRSASHHRADQRAHDCRASGKSPDAAGSLLSKFGHQARLIRLRRHGSRARRPNPAAYRRARIAVAQLRLLPVFGARPTPASLITSDTSIKAALQPVKLIQRICKRSNAELVIDDKS
jgi:hypothetical protein